MPTRRAAEDKDARSTSRELRVRALAASMNLGPKSAAWLVAAGATSLEQVKSEGSVAVYCKAKAVAPSVSLSLLWALEGAVLGVPWQAVAKERRASLLFALEDHEGRLLNSRADVKDIKNDWAQDISEVTKRRETINVIFSMAKGTPVMEVKDAVREYLKEEFGGKHEYIFALHTDTDNPHVHVCIKMTPIKKRSKRLNPRKNDLQRWREGFAQSLRKVGIQANATPRKTRGVAQQPSHQYQLHQSARQQRPIFRKSTKTNVEAHTKEIHAWANIANVLAKSEDLSDRALAKEVVAFMAEQPIRQVGNISVQKSNVDISTPTEQLSTGIKLKKRQEQLSK